MSQRAELKDTLLEELSNLDVFRRLVRYTSARYKLLRIVAALMASNKALPRRLSDAYVGRYTLPQIGADESDLDDVEPAGAGAAAAAGAGVGAGAENTATMDIVAIAASCLNHMTPKDNQATTTTGAAEALPMDALPDEDVLAIDLGLRLGSFLSEAGWMQESIAVLSCLNERLKRMQTFQDELITRLDCLQR